MSPSDLFGQVLTIEAERYGGQLRLVLSGDLDISSTTQLEEALEAAERSDAETICLDLRAVTFVDSMGLRAILSAQLRSTAGGKGLSLIPGSDRVQRVFAVTRTAELLHFEDGDAPPDNVRRLRGADGDR
jgi:anti-anti-sigma factor